MIGGRCINNLRYADDTTLLAESKEDLIKLLQTVKKEREKAGLYLNLKKKKRLKYCQPRRSMCLYWEMITQKWWKVSSSWVRRLKWVQNVEEKLMDG